MAKAEGEEAFQRKVEYLADFGQTIGIPDVDMQVLSQVMLTVLDEKWKDHLYDLDQLRNAIQYRACGQKDPLVEYKQEAFEMFEDLMRDIQSTFTERFLKIQVSAEPRRSRREVAPAARRPRRRPTVATHAPRRRAGPTICSWARRRGFPQSHPRRRRAAPRRRRPSPARSARWAGRPQPCRRSGGTIRVRAGRARSTRSVTERGGSPVRPQIGAYGPR